MKFIHKFLLVSSLTILLYSCASKEKIVYLNGDKATSNQPVKYEPIIQADDLLFIYVNAEDVEAASPFNVQNDPSNGNQTMGIMAQLRTEYLVDKEGYINFPVIGKIKLGGLTKSEALNNLKELVSAYVKDPVITLRLTNFKVSVLGEVRTPGAVNIQSERLTLLEALSRAGDLTIRGKRENILLIRESNGIKNMYRIDITKDDFINSPFYYLAQNDVIYVEPNKVQINSSNFGPNVPIIISLATLIFTSALIILTR